MIQWKHEMLKKYRLMFIPATFVNIIMTVLLNTLNIFIICNNIKI